MVVLNTLQMFSSVSLIVLLGSSLLWTLDALFDVVSALGCLKRIEKYLSTTSHASHRDMVERDANAPGRRSSTEHLYNNGQEIELRQFDETTREAASSSGATREANAIEVRGASFAWTD